ncbi:unnamed protein product [Microthlaspi erraticum]|uniref:DUF1985 domain-containing protein n=1 Tax=Microthlaspi erraticum TaxID=1685480 RepID=A0A6D2HUW5_9BRAS|nr:unnamed protein product [Microthlaspi erraticum]
MVETGVGKDVWESLKESSIGVIAKLKDVEYTFSAKIVHYLLTHQLQTKKSYEIWSLIDTQPIRLSLLEFGDITGLNCEPFKDENKWDLDHEEFWGELNVSTLEGPSLDQLELVFSKSADWTFEKRRMVGLLCLLSIGIYGLSPSSHIPLHQAKRVLNREAFESYPWGRVACKSLMDSIKMLSYGVKKTYTLSGCVHVLLIWAYEAIAGIGELHGNKRAGDEVPLLSWGGSRPRIEWSDFFRKEKKSHANKIRVRNFITLFDGETSAKWVDEEEDEDVKTLLDDIHHNRLDESAWDVIKANISQKKKRKEAVEHSDVDSKEHEKPTKTKKKEKKLEGVTATSDDQTSLVDMMKLFTSKVDNMETNIANKVLTGLDGAIDAKVDAKVELRFNPMDEKIATLEKEVKFLRERLGECDTKEAGSSNVNIDDDVTSNSMPWMVHAKSTSHDDLPIHVVVKNANKPCKKIEKLTKEQTVEELQAKLKGKQVQTTVTNQKKKIKQEPTSSETFSNPVHRRFRAGLNLMVAGICGVKDDTSLPKRQPKLSSSQLYPFVGNSTVKRIITGVSLSIAAYDPMTEVDETKAHDLLDFIRQDE